MWQCPLCHAALQQIENSWQCPQKHTFDRARSGYVNLLPVQQKRSLHPGDDKAMLVARRTFHQSLGYQPLMQCMVGLLTTHLAGHQNLSLYDAGCGEGSYLKYCTEGLTDAGYRVSAAGSDIAKPAVEMAAKSFPEAQFVVASSVSLPIINHQLDAILQVFAPGKDAEFARVLKPGGLLVTVEPGPDHLWQLKQRVYDNPLQHQHKAAHKMGFILITEQLLPFELKFHSAQQRDALFAMTPYVWRMNDQHRQTLDLLEQVNAEFVVRVWQSQPEDAGSIHHEQ